MEPLHKYNPWMLQSYGCGNPTHKVDKWVTHYSSSHQILLVGEGDFSFSLSLALAFGSASNIFATSLDSYDELIKKYGRARSNVEHLLQCGATILHGVDAKQMVLHPRIKMNKFDRIVFNFPHAGFYGTEDNPLMIKMHQNLVRGFFNNARQLLRNDGQIHVSHKTERPYSCWDIIELAHESSLQFIECVPFNIADHPCYQNKRGHGSASDDTFRLGECGTYKFTAVPSTEMFNVNSSHMIQRDIPFDHQMLHIEPNTFNSAAFSPKEIQLSFLDTQNWMNFNQRQMKHVKFIVKAEVRHSIWAAGLAGALVDEKDAILAMFHGPLSYMDTDVAELLAIKFALLMFERSKLCRKMALIVESNSVNAVSWIKSHYGNPRELWTDLEEIKMALGRIRDVEIRCRPTEYGVPQSHLVDQWAVKGLHMESMFEAWTLGPEL